MRLWPVLLAAWVSAVGAPAQEPSAAPDLDDLAVALEDLRQRFHIVGMSVAVVLDDEVVFARGFGQRQLERSLPATKDTIYALASVTKPFTAGLVAALVDRGEMHWDDAVRTHVEHFRLKDPRASDEITLRDLLTHRSGLRRVDMAWGAGTASPDQLLDAIALAEPVTEWRGEPTYANWHYWVVGLAAGEVGGAPWPELMKRHLLDPLGMTSTFTSSAQCRSSARLSQGYWYSPGSGRHSQTPLRDSRVIEGAAGLHSTVDDVARWIRLQLGRGRIDGHRLLEAERFDEMWSPQVELTRAARASEGQAYTLGWVTRDWNGRRMVRHGGLVTGFVAEVALLPDEGLGYVILSNTSNPESQAVRSAAGLAITDAFLGSDAARDLELEDVRELLGAYRFDSEGITVEVVFLDGGVAVDVPDSATWKLDAPDADGRWILRGSGGLVSTRFERDESGRVVSMIVHEPGNVMVGVPAGMAAPEVTTEPRPVEPAEPSPLAAELERLVRARCGADRLASVRNLVLSGRATARNQGVSGRFVLVAEPSGRLVQHFDLQPYCWWRALRDDSGWHYRSPFVYEHQGSLGHDELPERPHLCHPTLLLGGWDGLGEIELAETGDADGPTMHRLDASTHGGATTSWTIAEDGLPLRAEVEGVGTYAFSDYREVAGITLPMRISIEHATDGLFEILVDRAEADVALPGGTFRLDGDLPEAR